MRTSCKVYITPTAEGYDGEFTRRENYFIQNESGFPKLIKRTKKSVEKAVSGGLRSRTPHILLPAGELLVDRIIDYLKSLK